MRRSHTRYTEISTPCVIKFCLILSLLLPLLHEQIHIYIDGTYSKTFFLNNLNSRIQGRSQDLFRGTHNSPYAPNPVRHLPPPPPPMSPKVEVTVSLSVFTVSKITSCVYFHVLQTTSHKKISRCGRAGTAKKCTKKRAKHAKNRFNFFKPFAS